MELLAENDRINELDEETLKWWKEMGRDTRIREEGSKQGQK